MLLSSTRIPVDHTIQTRLLNAMDLVVLAISLINIFSMKTSVKVLCFASMNCASNILAYVKPVDEY